MNFFTKGKIQERKMKERVRPIGKIIQETEGDK